MQIQLLPEEYWWGMNVEEGHLMPLSAESEYCVDYTNLYIGNQSASLLLSSRGRYIWSEEPYRAFFSKGMLRIEQEVCQEEGHETLRGAYLHAMKAHFPFDGRKVEQEFFRVPQYNTWIELMYDQTQEGILRYAKGIVEHELPPGILMIDEGWAEDYGRFDFRKGAFPDPQGMMETLRQMGFRLMLWITPYISPDSATFREIEPKGYLLKDKNGETAIRRWWNGLSAVLDLSNAKAADWFYEKLHDLQEKYGVDGFKFDGGDPYMYRDDDRSAQGLTAMKQAQLYGIFGERFCLNEYRAAWNLGGEPLIMRLGDKSHSWTENGLDRLVPASLIQGLGGYIYNCPDMIGGGEIGSFRENSDHLDQELVVRYAQAAALCPMMQFSAAPWRILSEENLELVKEAAKLHEKFSDYICELVEEACVSGEPLMRHMAYEFPNQGFETIRDQFMLGSQLLVAPVLQKGQNRRQIKLPKGEWRAMDGKLYTGGKTIEVDAPLSVLPYLSRQ